MKRPFWMHQLVEYLLGIALVSQALRSSEPLVPAAAGALMALNAGIARGPLAALPKVSRPAHRILDLVVLAAVVTAALAGGERVGDTARWTMLGVAAVLAFMIWKTDYTTPVKRPPVSAPSGRSEEIGRLAGRATGRAVNAARRRRCS